MQRTKLLSDLVEIDAKITATTAMATRTHIEKEFERLIDEVRKLRKERAEVQAKLNALPPT
jgi:hypothetical protein